MITFIARRLLSTIPTLFGVLVVVFLLLNVVPGDPVAEMVGERADSATIARLRAELRLDDPLPVQFGHYLWGVVRGDLGHSYITQRPVLGDLAERFPKTLQLAGAAMLLAATVGITLGVIAAVRPHGAVDRFSMLLAYVGVSFPVYWVGLLLILLFAVTLQWLPPSGYGGPAFLVLPALTLGAFAMASIARLTRSALLEVLRADYVRTARAKGLRERVVVIKHALRNAAIPIVTITALQFGTLLGGAVVTETVFAWPGIGRLAIQSIYNRDYPVVQCVVFLSALLFIVINLTVELIYGVLDPRIRPR